VWPLFLFNLSLPLLWHWPSNSPPSLSHKPVFTPPQLIRLILSNNKKF
jgi:hypothetical protein